MKSTIVFSLLFATTFCFAQNISSSSYALDIFKKNGTMAIMVGSTMYAVQIKTTDKGDDATLAAQAAQSVGIKDSNYKYQYHKTMDCNAVKNKFSSVFTIYCSELSSSESKTSYGTPTQNNAPTVRKTTFTGTIVNGKKQGKGIYTDSSGNIIEGEFKDDLVNGYAIEKNTEYGQVYEANFVNGKKNGKGKLTFKDGSYYEGDFVNDWFQGKGRYVIKDNFVYEGDFLREFATGQGICTYNNGEIHSGEFYCGKLNGNGKLIKKSGYYAMGIFKKGIPVKVKYYNPSNEKISKKEFDANN